MWEGLTTISALGGVVLFASAGFFVLVMLGTLLAGKPTEPEPIIWAESLGIPEGGYRVTVWDRLGLWFAVAVVLVADRLRGADLGHPAPDPIREPGVQAVLTRVGVPSTEFRVPSSAK